MYGFIPYFAQVTMARDRAGVRPVQVQLVHEERRDAKLATGQRRFRKSIDRSRGKPERLAEIPPILAFQSVVDDTVDAARLITGLFDRLGANESEVVFFDVNRSDELHGFLSLDFANRLDAMMNRTDLRYTVTRLTNRHEQTHEVTAQSCAPGGKTTEQPLDLAWPPHVFSLAHVSIPFPPDDPLYGQTPPDPPVFGMHIGGGRPTGERKVLRIPASQLIRLRSNPFHSYIEDRIVEAVASDRAGGSADE